jgi:hypothetical protein
VNARGYYRHLQQVITNCPLVIDSTITFKEIDVFECYIKVS